MNEERWEVLSEHKTRLRAVYALDAFRAYSPDGPKLRIGFVADRFVVQRRFPSHHEKQSRYCK